ncbi:hypothetical protein [Fibrobacter sp.]|uniref:hypothetical protein n=1 Tax=Fibrobacter sp. TaxID=35828 RepID=UPI00386CAAB8
MRKHTMSQTEKAAYQLFVDALPYYWEIFDKIPHPIQFRLFVNGYGSAAMACVDIVNHWLSSPKLARDARKRLFHMQAWKGNKQ